LIEQPEGDAMKEKKLRGYLMLFICAAVLALSAFQINAVGRDLQYLVPAPQMQASSQQQNLQQDQQQDGEQEDQGDGQDDTPAAKPNQAALTLWESLKTAAESWSGSMETYTMSGILEKASMIADTEETKQARLTALNENAFRLKPQYLRFGRLFYPEELEKGSDGILLDEQLALALFKISEPIGRTVTVSGIKFTVIGILRHTKSVGGSEDYGAYVPLAYLWDKEIQLQALQVTVRPIPGAGARSTFATAMQNWSAGGTLIDLGKEAMGAMLPVRVLLFFAGVAVFFRLLSIWNGQFRRFFADYKQRLLREYAIRLMPRLTIGILVLAVGYGALALMISWLISYLVEPVYTFTEWVPAILVEWKDIQTAFWQVWQNASRLQEFNSPELNHIRFYGMLTGWFSAGEALSATVLWVRWWARRKRVKDKVLDDSSTGLSS
jgi:hypothetical protein